MTVSVKKITLWRKEAANTPGALAQVLGPLAENRAGLQVVMGYRIPGRENTAVIELFPVSGRQAALARRTGLASSDIPTLLVEGDDRPGLGHELAVALAQAGVNIGFLVAQVMGRRYSAVWGFESDADLAKASALIRKSARASARRRRTTAKRRATSLRGGERVGRSGRSRSAAGARGKRARRRS